MRKRLVSILFIIALLFSLTMPAFADTEPAAETPAAAEDAPAEAAPTEPPAADPAPASEAPAADTPAGEAPAAETPAAETPAAADSNNAPAAAPAAANDSAPAAAANDAAGSPAPVTKAAAANNGSPAGEANAEGGSEKAADAAKDTSKAASSDEKAGTEGTTADGQKLPAADPAQSGSGDAPAEEQKKPSEEAGEDKNEASEEGEDEKELAEEVGEDEKEPAEKEGTDEKEPAKEEGEDEKEPSEEGEDEKELVEEVGEDEKEPAEEEDEDLALGGALTDEEDAPKDAEQTEGGENADGEAAGGAIGGAQTAGSSKAADVSTVKETINAPGKLTVIMAGISEENRQVMTDALQKSLEAAIKDNKGLKITDPALIDAEKYLLSDYDSMLCWAATAANMLWTSQIAQQSINPATNANFQNVDEVFDYFRTIFTDKAGRPDGALSVFLKGSYPFQNSRLSQLVYPDNVTKSLPDGIKTPDFGLIDMQSSGVHAIDKFEKLETQSMGVLLHSYNYGKAKMGTLAHWVTSPGIVIDESKSGLARYKAIMIADSDNDPVKGDNSISDAEKAARAAKAPNSYTVYPLTLKEIPNHGQRWTIPFYDWADSSTFEVMIDWLAYVASIEPATKESVDILPGDEDDWDDGGWDEDDWDYEWEFDDEDDIVDESNEPANDTNYIPQNVQNVPDDDDWNDVDWDDFNWDDYDWEDMDMDELDEFLDAVPAERLPALIALAKDQDGGSGLLEALKIRMAEKNMEIFSPADWKYSLSKDGTFLVVVRTDPTQLLNVLLDGRLLTEYLKDYEVIDENTGTFLLVFSKDVMQSLEAGEHTLTLEINGIGELTRTITVVK